MPGPQRLSTGVQGSQAVGLPAFPRCAKSENQPFLDDTTDCHFVCKDYAAPHHLHHFA
jgi:hypothetical protein